MVAPLSSTQLKKKEKNCETNAFDCSHHRNVFIMKMSRLYCFKLSLAFLPSLSRSFI